ncbi:MAG: restriction endonuclease subunit S [Candidatus Electrothrix sp. AUS1_2]|nr:restriction endonuclease subunit S [Candidatus Electrothrix sp. AUS1_2]
MNHKELVKAIGLTPKNGTTGVFEKKYSKADNYALEVDFANERFNYGELIRAERETTLNFSQPESWVVFECVNRLLEQGYQPQHIILEKSYPVGRGSNIYLDILVTREDDSSFLMIECKTSGIEYDKELKKLNKDGGQIFSYFQQDSASDYLMVYASDFKDNTVSYSNEIIKIEDEYRQTDNVKDLYDIWNKLTKNNGIFEEGIAPYHFKSKALTPKHLKDITQEDSSKIFNRFLEILRHNVVSDKPNAFNKIFTLFLCKIYDEKSTMPNDELKFQWLEGIDDNVTFQKRLTDLYAKGMDEFLEKKVTDFSDDDFDNTFGNAIDAELRERLLKQFTRLRLEKNNEFAIKEVFDHDSFEDNGKVVKEVVELLQNYKIRYTKKQQYLSDFFELLLTTGLKQESGQFFTPVPVAQFVIRSLPIDTIVKQKLEAGRKNDLLPTIIDYASGSGHFLTESMHIIQELINNESKLDDYIPDTNIKLKSWRTAHFEWANRYIYGIEKDYRLVKVGKVGCYLHGDGIANVVHSDGLGNFKKTKEYTRKLKVVDPDNPQDNRQFDIVVSNPPYSVSAFRNNARKYYNEKDFELYSKLTDQSSEIECLFIERTKQLLKDGGAAGIILPSSILSNGGIYTKTREIILRFFEIIGIAELGSNTFMATNTNTVTLFLRRRKNRFAKDIENSVNSFAATLQDITVNGIEKPVAKYVAQVWEGLTFDDYRTLFQKAPVDAVKRHEIYQEYDQKINLSDTVLHDEIIHREKEKLVYFILTYGQQTVLVTSGEKKAEKAFLGYEFSNRRGSEGIHPIQRGKSIDECTRLYDADCFDNKEKASTYIYDAFAGNYSREIDERLKGNVRRVDLVDMLTFDRVDFDKSMSLAVKKKVRIESRWDLVKLSDVATINPPKKINEYISDDTTVSFIEMASVSNEGFVENKVDRKVKELKKGSYKFFQENDIVIAKITPCMENGKCAIVRDLTNGFGFGSSEFHIIHLSDKVLPEYVFSILNTKRIREIAETHMTGASGHRRVPDTFYSNIRIPLPPKDIQEKIVAEIAVLENQVQKAKKSVEDAKKEIGTIVSSFTTQQPILEICSVSKGKINPQDTPEEILNYIGLENIESNTGKLVDFKSSRAGNIQSTKNVFKKRDVLYGKLRPYLNKVWIAEFDGVCSTDILVLETEQPQILKQILLSDNFVSNSSGLMKGVSLPRLQVKDFLAFKIPYPVEADEKSVVKQIEKIETKIAELEATIANIPAQKEAILRKYL